MGLKTPFIHSLMTPKKEAFDNIVGTGENAGNQHYHLFPPCFLPIPKQILISQFHLILSLANAFNLDQSKILSFGKEFTVKCWHPLCGPLVRLYHHVYHISLSSA